MTLPPPVEARLDDSVRDYWLRRVAQHSHDSYAGIPLAKFPEDLRVYEHLVWESRANVVVELGTYQGASALWLRDRLKAFHAYGRIGAPLVISIDLSVEPALRNIAEIDPTLESLELLAGDVRDTALPGRVEERLPPDARCLMIEDSAHTYETTSAALQGFARFVHVGGYFVVEDGCVDIEEMRLGDDWPRGVLPALRDWLETDEGRCFEVRRDLELYGISCHPCGWLRRKSVST